MQRDLTTGSLRQAFRALAVPAAIGMTFTTLYNVVDVYWAGGIDTQAQASLAVAFQAFFLFIAFGLGMSSALSALVGGAEGARDADSARRYALQGVGLAALGSAALMALSLFLVPLIFELISAPGPYRDGALRYFYVLVASMPGFILAFAVNGVLQALGDAVSHQRALIAAFFLNLGLNPLLIFGWPGVFGGLGFDGIALATVISQTGVALYVGWRLSRVDLAAGARWRDFLPERGPAYEIAAQALPTMSALIVMMTAGIAIQFYLKGFGEAAVAGYGVALRVEQMFLLPVFGLTGALLPIAAQNFGAGHYDRVRESLWVCIRLGGIYMLIACPTLLIFAPALMRFFTPDPEVIAVGVSYLRVDGIILPIYMTLFAINSFLQALKRPSLAFWIGVYRQALGVPIFAGVFALWLGFGVPGVWYGVATAVATGAVWAFLAAHLAARGAMGNGLFERTAPATAQ